MWVVQVRAKAWLCGRLQAPTYRPQPLLQVAREIRIHTDLHHEGIISMFAAWSDPRFVYIAMEWAPEAS